MARSQAGYPFSPKQVGGCQLWLRSDLGVTLNGTGVAQWNDQSGNANNVVQATPANQPVWNASDANYGGKPSISFTQASSQVLTGPNFTLAQPWSFFWVATGTAPSTYKGVFGTVSSTLLAGTSNGSPPKWTVSTMASTTTSAATSCIVGWFSGFGVYGASPNDAMFLNVSTSINGSHAAGPGSFDGTALQVGCSNNTYFMDGTIAEIALFTNVITPSDVTNLMTYAGLQYGQTWA